jgi:Fur family ferric uptake transcriptional regulator
VADGGGGRPDGPGARTAWEEHTLLALRRAGLRSGGARRAVVAHLGRQECCVSAQEIFDGLRAEGGRHVGIASVYRALDTLSALGLVQRLELGGAATRYEPAQPSGDHHHHLVCQDCGEVRPFLDVRLEAALDGAAERSAFSVDEHDVVLRGRCPACTA